MFVSTINIGCIWLTGKTMLVILDLEHIHHFLGGKKNWPCSFCFPVNHNSRISIMLPFQIESIFK